MRPEPDAGDERPLPRPPRGQRLARLAFVLSLSPGLVVLMVLAPALRSPGLLAAGLALVTLALLGHRRLTAAILTRAGAQEARDAAPSRLQPPESL